MSAVDVPQPQLARTEADLVGAVRSGDDGAFGELYSRYGGPVLGYVNRILGDHGRAEDVTQDVFVSALRAMRSSDRAIAFKPWIYEIARNACIDEFRRRQRTREVSVDGDQAVAERRDMSATAPSPDAFLERRQQLEHLRGAFSGLSESQHKVLVLREFEGRSYTQIAARTGMSVPRVESTLFRARRRLGQEYDEIASGRRCEQVHGVIDGGGEEAVRALGLRERRRFARHIAHCQPCQRQARLAGIDESALRIPSLAERLAALLPLPFAPWRRLFGEGRGSRALRALHRATQFSHPGAAAGAGQAAVVVVAAAMAVGGIADGLKSPASHASPASAAPAALIQSTHSGLGLGPPRTPSLAPSRPAHRAGHTNRGHQPASSRQSIPGRSHPSSTPPASGPLGSSPSLASPDNLGIKSPSIPSSPGLPKLPSLPGQILKSTEPGLGSLLHRTSSTTKQVTKLLRHLPLPPLRRVQRDR